MRYSLLRTRESDGEAAIWHARGFNSSRLTVPTAACVESTKKNRSLTHPGRRSIKTTTCNTPIFFGQLNLAAESEQINGKNFGKLKVDWTARPSHSIVLVNFTSKHFRATNLGFGMGVLGHGTNDSILLFSVKYYLYCPMYV